MNESGIVMVLFEPGIKSFFNFQLSRDRKSFSIVELFYDVSCLNGYQINWSSCSLIVSEFRNYYEGK